MQRKLLLILFPIFGMSLQCFSQGNLLVTPTRVVFEGNKQKEKIYLVNTGKDTTTFSISFIQNRQTEDGRYTQFEKPDSGQMLAEPYLRIYPRSVSLAPGETQSVMIYTRRRTDMLPGEYRSHLYFRSEKDYTALGSKSKDTLKTVRIQLIPIYGISIPILIRSGEVNVSTSLSDLVIDNSEDPIFKLKLTINRTGNISVNGDITVDYIPEQGRPYEIGKIKSVAVYTDNSKRFVSIKLNAMKETDFKGGTLKVRYTSVEDAKKQEVYSETELKL